MNDRSPQLQQIPCRDLLTRDDKSAQPSDQRETLAFSDNSITADGCDLRSSFCDYVPQRPYCSDRFAEGLRIRPRRSALQYRHLQLNGPHSYQWMLHDIDQAGAWLAHRDANLPQPNFIAANPNNGHAHSAYLLARPVLRHAASRLRPLRFFAAVERGIARRLSADRHYGGLLAKNPLHPDWKVEWRRDVPYSLPELADALFFEDMAPEQSIDCELGAGRNVTVFDQLRRIAYAEIRRFKVNVAGYDDWLNRCEQVAIELNHQFAAPLRFAEVRAIAKSVSKWVWRHFSIDQFRERQSRLGKAGLAKRWAGHTAASTTQPWVEEGISRATFYRRRKKREQP